MKTLLIIIATVVLLSGCFQRNVPNWLIERSDKLCKDHGGVNYIMPLNYFVSCKDGAVIRIFQFEEGDTIL